MPEELKEGTCLRRLPTVVIRGVEYFVDACRHQLMEVTDPHSSVDFHSEKAWESLLEYCGVHACPYCRELVEVGAGKQQRDVVCPRCSLCFPIL